MEKINEKMGGGRRVSGTPIRTIVQGNIKSQNPF